MAFDIDKGIILYDPRNGDKGYSNDHNLRTQSAALPAGHYALVAAAIEVKLPQPQESN